MSLINTSATINLLLLLTRDLPDRFQRKRVWSPQSLMIALMLLTRPARALSYRGIQHCMELLGLRLFGWEKAPSISSMSGARTKLTAEDCRHFLHQVVGKCESFMTRNRNPFTDRRCVAFDGTRIITKRSHDTVVKLPRQRAPDGVRIHHPQGLMVFAVDLTRRLPLDWVLLGKKKGERTGLKNLINILRPRDIAIIDRGFPSREIFGLIIEKGADFIARMSVSQVTGWKEVQDFVLSGAKQARISMTIVSQGKPVEVSVRLVERPRQRGRPRKGTTKEAMVLVTNLREADGFDLKTLVKMYGSRWGVETLIRELKSFIALEPVHTMSVQGVNQEIAASLLWMALGSMMQAQAEDGLPDGRRVVRADCLRAATELMDELIFSYSTGKSDMELLGFLRKNSQIPQGERHYPRVCNYPHGRSVGEFG